MRKINKIILHHSATPCDSSWTTQRIRDVHVKQNEWSDIGYHFVIESDGTIHYGRPLSKVGAHCKGFNTDSIGICIVGGLDYYGMSTRDAFNQIQFIQAKRLIMVLSSLYNIALCNVKLHRDLAPTACPAFDLSDIFDL